MIGEDDLNELLKSCELYQNVHSLSFGYLWKVYNFDMLKNY